MSSLTRDLSEIARSSSPMANLSEKLFNTVFDITSKAAFGEKYEAREELMFLTKMMLKSSESRSICEMFPSQKWLALITGMKGKWDKMHNLADKVLEKIIRGAAHKPLSKIVEGGEARLSSLCSAES